MMTDFMQILTYVVCTWAQIEAQIVHPLHKDWNEKKNLSKVFGAI